MMIRRELILIHMLLFVPVSAQEADESAPDAGRSEVTAPEPGTLSFKNQKVNDGEVTVEVPFRVDGLRPRLVFIRRRTQSA